VGHGFVGSLGGLVVGTGLFFLVAVLAGEGGFCAGLVIAMAAPMLGFVVAAAQQSSRRAMLLQAELVEAVPAAVEAATSEHEWRASSWRDLSSPSVSIDRLLAVVERELEGIDFPFSATCMAGAANAGEVVVAVDLPEIEDLYSEVTPQQERQAVYAHTVSGIAYQVARHVFLVAPCVQTVAVAGYTQRRAADGSLRDEYVFELRLSRSESAQQDFAVLAPIRALTGSKGSRIKLTKTHKLSRIPAPSWAP